MTRNSAAYLTASSLAASLKSCKILFCFLLLYDTAENASLTPVRDVPSNLSRCWTSFHEGNSKSTNVIRNPALADIFWASIKPCTSKSPSFTKAVTFTVVKLHTPWLSNKISPQGLVPTAFGRLRAASSSLKNPGSPSYRIISKTISKYFLLGCSENTMELLDILRWSNPSLEFSPFSNLMESHHSGFSPTASSCLPNLLWALNCSSVQSPFIAYLANNDS